MIDDALAPDAAQLRIDHSRHDRGVLHGYHALIVVAVECPSLYLAAVELTRMQKLVERMQVMVALGADRTQALFKLARAQQRGHSVISIPS